MEAPAAPEENDNLFSMTLTQRGSWQVSVNGKLFQQSGKPPKRTIDEEADITSLLHVLRCSNWKEHSCPARATITQDVPTDDMEAREGNKKLYFEEEFSSFILTIEDHSDRCPNVELFTEKRAFTKEIKDAMAADLHLQNTLWQYVHKLQLSQQAQETRYTQHLLGRPISRIQERKQRDKEKTIVRIKENFVAERYDTLLQYCQALSAYMYSAA
jgi:hypothetical protein